MNVLVLGSGGREHALSWKIAQSSQIDKLFIAPGNAGTNQVGVNVDIQVSDFDKIKAFCLEEKIEFVVVGPEQPLVDGIADYFMEDPEIAHIAVIGPNKKAAQLEGSKDFSKQFMKKYNIPTAKYMTVTAENLEEGYAHLDSMKSPYVLKADGLAAGKGVLIIDDLDEAKKSLREMIEDEKFGDASKSVVVEEFLDGIELSVFVITDGQSYKILPEAKDYKKIKKDDNGLNKNEIEEIEKVILA